MTCRSISSMLPSFLVWNDEMRICPISLRERDFPPLILFLLIVLMTGACDQKKQKPPASRPLVSIAKSVMQSVPVFKEYVGATESIQSVELLARVEGFLQVRNFEEGSEIKEGDLLYVIDPDPFKAALEQAEGQLDESQAGLIDAKKKLERERPLAKQDFISRQAFDNFTADVKQYEGKVKANQAAVEQAKLNLSYCTMHAPFSGRIGYTQVNVGNLVGPDKNPKLAELVKLDPIYVVFRPSAEDLPLLAERQSQAPVPVSITLSEQIVYPLQGKIDAIDNRIDTKTDTIKVRAILPNPEKTLVPGEYTNVKVDLGVNNHAITIPQQALVEQQAGYQVYVLTSENTVQVRPVVIGAAYKDRQMIKSGLNAGETIVTSGQQKLKSGTTVKLAPTKVENTVSGEPQATPDDGQEKPAEPAKEG